MKKAGIARKRRKSVIQRFWRSGGVDRDVDRVARGADEAGERVRDEGDEGGHVRVVADVRGEEAVQRSRPSGRGRARRTSSRSRPGTPRASRASARRSGGCARRSRKKTVSRERRPSSVELEPDRVRRQRPVGAERLGVGVRIAVGEEQDVGVGLRRVAEPVGAEVPEPERHPAEWRATANQPRNAQTAATPPTPDDARPLGLRRRVRPPATPPPPPTKPEPSVAASISAGIARNEPERRLPARLALRAPGSRRRPGSPAAPVKPGYGFAASAR